MGKVYYVYYQVKRDKKVAKWLLSVHFEYRMVHFLHDMGEKSTFFPEFRNSSFAILSMANQESNYLYVNNKYVYK